jgi:probable rRNA maturation factor
MAEKDDSAALEVDVLSEYTAWQANVPDADIVCRSAAAAAYRQYAAAGRRSGTTANVCILLAGDDRVRELNRMFRGRDEATNVLSFPSVEPDVLAAAGADGLPQVLGDIVVAFETSAAEAQRDGITLSAHLSHLVVHAMLHLVGYDHAMELDAVEMEGLETRILASLGVADPYMTVDERR